MSGQTFAKRKSKKTSVCWYLSTLGAIVNAFSESACKKNHDWVLKIQVFPTSPKPQKFSRQKKIWIFLAETRCKWTHGWRVTYIDIIAGASTWRHTASTARRHPASCWRNWTRPGWTSHLQRASRTCPQSRWAAWPTGGVKDYILYPLPSLSTPRGQGITFYTHWVSPKTPGTHIRKQPQKTNGLASPII